MQYNVCTFISNYMSIRVRPLILVFVIAVIFPISQSVFADGGYIRSLLVENAFKLQIFGSAEGGQAGSAIGVGDFNGDGVDDVVIGAPFSSKGVRTWNGAAGVVFGSSRYNGRNGIYKDTYDVDFTGAFSGDQFGGSLAVGDFNGDGVDDIAMGAHNAYYSGNRPGRVYIVYGHVDMGRQSLDFLKGKPDLVLTGVDNGDGFGLKLFVSDVDGDGYDDLLVGAPMAKKAGGEKTGAVYFHHGDRNGLLRNSLQTLYGEEEGERFGSSIALGDLNGDGHDDVAVGAYLLGNENFSQYGRVYLFKNKGSVFSKYDSYINGKDSKGWFGFDIYIDKYDGDDVDDLLVSSFPYMGNGFESKVEAFLGGRNFFLERENVDVLEGGIGEAVMGSQVSSLKVDGDGLTDIVVGAPGIGSPVSYEAGKVYIRYGNGDYSIITGEAPDDWFGYSSEVLDFNADGYRDIVVGARYANVGDLANNGKTYIIFGDGKPFGDVTTVVDESKLVTRGRLVRDVVDRLDLKNTKADEVENCLNHGEFCLFNFMAMSSFNDISTLDRFILYPDVAVGDMYYDEITIATVLGFINGYLDEDQSPFHPERSVSRIQALKVVLGASDLVEPRYKFELVDALGSSEHIKNQFSYFDDVDAQISHMWWYPRYVNFAVDNGIIDDGDLFRPDDNITIDELNDIIERTVAFKAGKE